MDDSELTKGQIRAIALATAGIYAVVVAYIGFAFLSDVVATAAYVLAIGGGIATYVIINWVYTSIFHEADEGGADTIE